MKTYLLVGPLLLGAFAFPGAASAQVEASHSTNAGTARVAHVAATMRHVGARTTYATVAAPSAGETATENTTIRVPRLPAVHFRH